jgi:YD repeat-containing protein
VYDAANRLIERTDALNQIVEFEYDTAGRQIVKRTQDANGNVEESRWWWDNEPVSQDLHGHSIGRVVQIDDPKIGAVEGVWYDAMGRTTRHRKCVGTTCASTLTTYDRLGRPVSIVYPDVHGDVSPLSETVTYQYNAVTGRLQAMQGYVDAIVHGPSGRLESMLYSNGVKTRIGYDAQREWLARIDVEHTGTSATLFSATYDRDDRGKIVYTAEQNAGSVTLGYEYDELGRLLEVTGSHTQSLRYDAIGNVIDNSAIGVYEYTDAAHVHAVTQAGGNTYVYDANGNMTEGAGR